MSVFVVCTFIVTQLFFDIKNIFFFTYIHTANPFLQIALKKYEKKYGVRKKNKGEEVGEKKMAKEVTSST